LIWRKMPKKVDEGRNCWTIKRSRLSEEQTTRLCHINFAAENLGGTDL
jgi:hypothetical protein